MKFANFRNLEDKIHYVYRLYYEGERKYWPPQPKHLRDIEVMSYVGVTINPDNILEDKIKEGKKNQRMINGKKRPIVAAIEKFGPEAFNVEILCKVKGYTKGIQQEERFIKKFNSNQSRETKDKKFKKIKNKVYGGYNITKGGDKPFLTNRYQKYNDLDIEIDIENIDLD